MQTNFTAEQLRHPQNVESEKIIRKCVHCGFCTATCPTYVLLGDELDSPRGRIYLMKEMMETGRPATPEIVKHIDRCLSCLACMTTCPSGVHYQHLVDHGRAYIERTYRRPFPDRVIRTLLATVLPYPTRFRLALAAAVLGKPLKGLFRGIQALKPVAAMLDLAPGRPPGRSALEGPRVIPAEGPRRARVALLSSCAQPVLAPHIHEATIRLLTRHGVEVVLAQGEGCCGAIVHHMGDDHRGQALARRNIDAWTREIEGEGL
ncbi:MAG: 4Fe-4S dicluster domain-containing protein, partial [Pseudomonadota bacterium]|nr:4Fe-4S dicluster domain-containing protein [Pseudomonadota bacterium]